MAQFDAPYDYDSDNDVAASIYLINKKLQEIKKPDKTRFAILSGQVGATGFEPTTSTSRTWRATGLRYAPMIFGMGCKNRNSAQINHKIRFSSEKKWFP
jgi:hypothetical protein